MILGLTGGIGTGKSTVAKMLREKNIPVVDTDSISKEIIEYPEVIEKIKAEISSKIFNNENKLDRKKLSEIVFENKDKLKKLNEIMHPVILKKMWEEVEKLKKDYKVIVVDIPLLFEINMENEVDKVLLIYSSKEIQIERIMNRDGRTREEAIKIINSQMPLYKKREKSDYIIQNNDSLEKLEKNLDKVVQKL